MSENSLKGAVDLDAVAEESKIQVTKYPRLHSLDALRGFDMFWIIGGGGLFHALAKCFDWPFFQAINAELHHVEWDGSTFYDMIFPLFLFIAGVAMPFSLTNRIASGTPKRKLMQHVIIRGFILVLLGMIYNNGFFQNSIEETRFPSVLGRIGLAYMLAGLIVINTKWRMQAVWFAGLLLGYWWAMTNIHVPDIGAGILTMEGNLASYIDRHILPGRLHKGIHDPEGLFSTIPAIGTALMGALTGRLLNNKSRGIKPWKKAVIIASAGIAFLWLGKTWNIVFPINKNLWSSSFAVYAGGWSMIFLSMFYLVIDVWGFKKWAFVFIVIGMNSILIYMAPKFLNFGFTANALFGGLIKHCPEDIRPVLAITAALAFKWALLFVLYRKKFFLRV